MNCTLPRQQSLSELLDGDHEVNTISNLKGKRTSSRLSETTQETYCGSEDEDDDYSNHSELPNEADLGYGSEHAPAAQGPERPRRASQLKNLKETIRLADYSDDEYCPSDYDDSSVDYSSSEEEDEEDEDDEDEEDMFDTNPTSDPNTGIGGNSYQPPTPRRVSIEYSPASESPEEYSNGLSRVDIDFDQTQSRSAERVPRRVSLSFTQNATATDGARMERRGTLGMSVGTTTLTRRRATMDLRNKPDMFAPKADMVNTRWTSQATCCRRASIGQATPPARGVRRTPTDLAPTATARPSRRFSGVQRTTSPIQPFRTTSSGRRGPPPTTSSGSRNGPSRRFSSAAVPQNRQPQPARRISMGLATTTSRMTARRTSLAGMAAAAAQHRSNTPDRSSSSRSTNTAPPAIRSVSRTSSMYLGNPAPPQQGQTPKPTQRRMTMDLGKMASHNSAVSFPSGLPTRSRPIQQRTRSGRAA